MIRCVFLQITLVMVCEVSSRIRNECGESMYLVNEAVQVCIKSIKWN